MNSFRMLKNLISFFARITTIKLAQFIPYIVVDAFDYTLYPVGNYIVELRLMALN
jgi:hypothetical protein